MINNILIQLQIYSDILVTEVLELYSKFLYLYIMSRNKKLEFRNQVAQRIRELKSLDDENMSLAKMKVIEFYAWMCKNQ